MTAHRVWAADGSDYLEWLAARGERDPGPDLTAEQIETVRRILQSARRPSDAA